MSKDLEAGLTTATARSVIPSEYSSGQPVQPHTPLELFQLLVGIHTPSTLLQDASGNTIPKHRSATDRDDNIGLYQRAKDQERTSRYSYISTSFISNTLYMLQIILAATFTALSSYKETNAITLTALGAVNTVLAGALAWQKGQGVPQRYRKARDQYQALIAEIEMTERTFLDLTNNGATETGLDPRTEMARLQHLFEIARADQQANYPDLYVSTSAFAAKDSKDLTKELEDVKAEAVKVQQEMSTKIDTLMKELESKSVAKVESVVVNAAKV